MKLTKTTIASENGDKATTTYEISDGIIFVLWTLVVVLLIAMVS